MAFTPSNRGGTHGHSARAGGPGLCAARTCGHRRRPRRERMTSSGGSSSSGSRTHLPLPGLRGAVTTVATPRSRSAGRASRLSARAEDALDGRAALCRSPGSPMPLWALGLVKRYDGVVALGGVDLRRAARPGGGARRAERIRQDDGCCMRSPGSRGSTPASACVAGAPAGGRDARSRLALVPDEQAGFDELTVAELVSLVHALWRAGPGGGGVVRHCCSRRSGWASAGA